MLHYFMFHYFNLVPFDIVLFSCCIFQYCTVQHFTILKLLYVMLHYFDTDLFGVELFNVAYRKNGTQGPLRTQILKGSWVLGPLRVLVPPFQVYSLMLLFLYCIKVALCDDALFDAALFRYCSN